MHTLNVVVVSVLGAAGLSGSTGAQAGDMVSPEPVFAAAPPEPGRGQDVEDFDFWLGTWSVANTRRDGSGQWTDTGDSVAKITPMLDGRVVFERWDGMSGGFASTFGMSLRYFDEKVGRWVVLLSWPGGNPVTAGFGVMEGFFADGMCELHPPGLFEGPGTALAGRATRFVFSDAQDESCRWTMQAPVGGDGWQSTWSMAFTRIESDEDVEPGRLPVVLPPEECACLEESARAADWLIGEWTGEEGVGLYATSINRGCGTVLSIDTAHGEMIFVLAYNRAQDVWEAREIGASEPLELRSWTVSVEDGLLLTGPEGETGLIERRGDDEIRLVLSSPGGEAESFDLQR